MTTRPGEERRRVILQRAAHIASVEGLDGVSLGRLAAALEISKSGLQGLFGTKQDLQLEIVAAATSIFEQRVLRPAERAEHGLPQVRALFDAWIDYLDVFEGGCFFIAAASELDGRTGPVREAIVGTARVVLQVVGGEIRLACRLGELDPDTDVDQLIFELHGSILEANLTRRLFGHQDAADRARRAIHDRLDRAVPLRRATD